MQPARHDEGISRLRLALDGRREWMGQVLAGRDGSGIAACAGLSDTYDQLVVELWQASQDGSGPDAWRDMCLVATGGWGRREVCPYSDIDLLLLAPLDIAEQARVVAEQLLYPLWDAGIQVGHAVRDPGACVHLARHDLATATALMDARFLAGRKPLYDELARGIRSAVAPGGNPNALVSKLARERERRHARFGDSLYLLEPNLKQGIGALRDLSTAVWAAHARWAVGQLAELVAQGQVSSRQARLLEAARDFLLRLRSLLQLHAGRATDQLTFEIQEAVAPRLYPDARAVEPAVGVPANRVSVEPAVAPAVEALMRDYYLHGRAVVHVADRLLEAARVPERRKPRLRAVDSGFLLWNGQLAVADPAVFRVRPSEMVRLFRVALDQDVAIYGHTKELVAERLAVEPDALADDAEAARHFVDALCDLRDARQPSLLEEMHQVGLLAAVMPEFAPCTCRVQHDLYHVYTVDQHQLYTLAMLKRTLRGELADEAPLATQVARELGAAGRAPALLLATLLHDVGKPLGKGHSEKGARLAVAVARRLGFAEDQVLRAEMLVKQHLTMAHLSQRRDLNDREVVRRFAERIGDEVAVAQLYLLTRCDTAMTAPGNLSAWKDQLLGELYTRAREQYRGAGAGEEPEEPRWLSKLEAERARVRELLPAEAPELEALVGALDDRFIASLTPREIARQLVLAQRRAEAGAPVEIEVTEYPLKHHTDVAVVADDCIGLLSHIAGVLAAHRVSIDAAVVTTVEPPGGGPALALDRFSVRDPYGKPIAASDPRWPAIRTDLGAVVQQSEASAASAAVDALLERRRRRSNLRPRVTPAVPTTVQVVQDASQDFTVIEVAARDRVGVLHTITRTMTEQGLDIHLAKVSTEGERVADAFYVTDRRAGGGKLAGAERVREVEEALYAALETPRGEEVSRR